MRGLLVGLICLSPLMLRAEWFKQTEGIMGTNIQVEIWADSAELGKQAVQSVMDEMRRIDELMSPYKASSELSLINRQAGLHPIKISAEMFEVIETAQNVSDRTDGAFDITFASVGFLYDYRQHSKPDEQQIEQLLDAINFHHIRLDKQQLSIHFNHPDVKIDLGGIAKGYAVDNALEKLRALGIEHALVTAGGDTGLLGDRRGKPWIVGIRDPRHRDREAVVLPLENMALSTSGDYERYFEQDGERYHHILSPKSGKSSHEVQSVSILGAQSILTDGLSTAVFVLGVKAGIELLNRIPGYEGIIMDNQRKLHYSAGLASQSIKG
ncbi:FAD:protein FMN transferase [Neptunicella sp. SCSIO 80796]|uniref:FAD:protein FMN transferase n=1 Tax=Neptunicella plasticusilytica TaxID=3117012 RepID=UPI003A4DD74A